MEKDFTKVQVALLRASNLPLNDESRVLKLINPEELHIELIQNYNKNKSSYPGYIKQLGRFPVNPYGEEELTDDEKDETH